MMWKIALAAMAALATTAPEGADVYADTFMVTNVHYMESEDLYELELTAQNGNVFIWADEDGDWMEGDLTSCILCDMGTDAVTDDEILTVKYSGWVTGSWVRE